MRSGGGVRGVFMMIYDPFKPLKTLHRARRAERRPNARSAGRCAGLGSSKGYNKRFGTRAHQSSPRSHDGRLLSSSSMSSALEHRNLVPSSSDAYSVEKSCLFKFN